MEAGLLFYQARRTSVCQKILEKYLNCFGIRISGVRFCAEENQLNAGMSRLLHEFPTVFAVCSLENGRPVCSVPVFRTLKVPLDGQNEPVGVRRIPGVNAEGYLIESSRQAILLLPDDPCELIRMMPQSCDGLKRKFGLNGSLPSSRKTDFDRLVTSCMGTPETLRAELR